LLVELTHRSRFATAAAMGLLQVLLSYFLWHALYAHTTVSAGLTVDQAVSYATLAVLVSRIRWGSRIFSRDSVWSLVDDGRIVYWFLRPISPQRYYLTKALGETCYWGAWSAAGFALALATGLVTPPPSAAVAGVSALSLLLGQLIEYQLLLAVDLLCFWLVSNNNARRVYHFAADFLSGAFVPLWYLPSGFVAVAKWLPFQSTLNVPLSFYIGRVPVAAALGPLTLQAVWWLVLHAGTRAMWRGAERRVAVQGG
jgi:ABC-2 type transport system permease protein